MMGKAAQPEAGRTAAGGLRFNQQIRGVGGRCSHIRKNILQISGR